MSNQSGKLKLFQNRSEMRSDKMFALPTLLGWKKPIYFKKWFSTILEDYQCQIACSGLSRISMFCTVFSPYGSAMNLAFKSAENCQFFIFRKNKPKTVSYFKMSKKTHS